MVAEGGVAAAGVRVLLHCRVSFLAALGTARSGAIGESGADGGAATPSCAP